MGFKEQVGFGKECGLSRLWKDMKGFALSRDSLMVAQHRKSPSCSLLWLKTNTTEPTASALEAEGAACNAVSHLIVRI